ncbi:hypothetical protein HDU96_010845 [Phlyctochytrium bullatum]|nr:hypothetical protein HDU96_010845 [Phlyctochytrium bullatum]
MGFWALVGVPETRGKTLEDIDEIFGSPSANTSANIEVGEEKKPSAYKFIQIRAPQESVQHPHQGPSTAQSPQPVKSLPASPTAMISHSFPFPTLAQLTNNASLPSPGYAPMPSTTVPKALDEIDRKNPTFGWPAAGGRSKGFAPLSVEDLNASLEGLKLDEPSRQVPQTAEHKPLGPIQDPRHQLQEPSLNGSEWQGHQQCDQMDFQQLQGSGHQNEPMSFLDHHEPMDHHNARSFDLEDSVSPWSVSRQSSQETLQGVPPAPRARRPKPQVSSFQPDDRPLERDLSFLPELSLENLPELENPLLLMDDAHRAAAQERDDSLAALNEIKARIRSTGMTPRLLLDAADAESSYLDKRDHAKMLGLSADACLNDIRTRDRTAEIRHDHYVPEFVPAVKAAYARLVKGKKGVVWLRHEPNGVFRPWDREMMLEVMEGGVHGKRKARKALEEPVEVARTGLRVRSNVMRGSGRTARPYNY